MDQSKRRYWARIGMCALTAFWASASAFMLLIGADPIKTSMMVGLTVFLALLVVIIGN